MLAASARGVLTANARRQSTTSSRRCLSSLAQSLSFDSGELNCRRTLVPITLKPVISQSSIRWFSPTAIASADLPYHIVVGMPALSPTMEQGIISKWNVKEGDSFAAGDSLAVIETDKASMDFEAQDDGVVAKLLVKEGTSDVKVGTEIMVTVEDTADVGAFASFVAGLSAAPASSSASTPPPVTAPSPKRDVATPAPAAAIPAPTAVTLAAPTAAPAAAVTAAPSGAISLGGTEWGLLAAVKSPLAKMMASKQKEYISKYGSSGHVPVV